MSKRYQLLTATSMGVRLTPANHQPVGVGNQYTMTSTSAESNVLNVAASLGMRTKVLTRWVQDSPVAAFIKGDLRRRNIEYEGPEIAQEGPWGVRHQFNIADTGYGMRGPRVYNDRAGEVGRGICPGDFDLKRIFEDEGVPLTLIGESVFARCLSALKEERATASRVLAGVETHFEGNRERFIEDIQQALYASKIVSYAQGYQLMRAAAKTHGWNLNYGGIALMWRGGCIIRSRFLDRIKAAFDADPDLGNLMLDGFFRDALARAQAGWRRVCAEAMQNGIPVPSFASALSYYDGYRCERLPANLLQAQRDYFGAHTYERTDAPRGTFFHTNWTGEGSDTTAGTYSI